MVARYCVRPGGKKVLNGPILLMGMYMLRKIKAIVPLIQLWCLMFTKVPQTTRHICVDKNSSVTKQKYVGQTHNVQQKKNFSLMAVTKLNFKSGSGTV